MKLKLVSFAEGGFKPRARRFAAEAKAMEMFDTIEVHSLDTLSADFVAKHGAFLRGTPRGFGCWLWKPEVVLEALRAAVPDDVIFYADVGFALNPAGRRRMQEYGEMARASSHRMLSFSNTHTEYLWTKRDLAARLGVDGNLLIMGTTQLGAGFQVLQKTAENIALMEDWIAIGAEDNYHFIDDSPSRLPNDARFREHRHDASIGSLLRKIRGATVTHYEVQAYDQAYEMYRPMLPMHAARLRE